jgi:DtxR family Mn-dependent transcriptional regulator
MIERIDERLGHPQRCPHGWPVDTEAEKEENRHLAPLADLAPGSRATVVRLAEHDGELLHWFYDEGLAPGTELELLKQAAGQVTVRVGGVEKTMGEKAAQGLYVRAA